MGNLAERLTPINRVVDDIQLLLEGTQSDLEQWPFDEPFTLNEVTDYLEVRHDILAHEIKLLKELLSES
jgi:hypothetical protein